jgi:hypothetical protein
LLESVTAVEEVIAAGLVVGIVGNNNWFLENKLTFEIRVFLGVGGVTSDLLALLVSIDGIIFGK